MLSKIFHLCNLLVLIVATAIGVRIFLFSRPCQSDEIVPLPTSTSSTLSLHACDAFSESYDQARSSFLSHANKLGLETWSLPIVPENDYTTDITVLPGDQQGLVIHTSGTHGVEGYAGSAIQLAFLNQMIKEQEKNGGQWKPLPGKPTVILVHAINPHGMARFRRPNENNVDLNRNSLTNEELESLKTSHTNHKNYRRFDEELFNYAYERPPSKFYSYFGIWYKAARQLMKEGFSTLKAAMVAGQYYQKDGIFFGGNELQTSIVQLEAWFREYFVNQTSITNFGGITWIDVHTGLGPMGVDTILAHYPNRDEEGRRNLQSQVTKWFPDAVYSSSNPSLDEGGKQNDVSQGYDQSKGFIIDYFERYVLPNGTNVENEYKDDNHLLMMVQEFGTVPGMLVGHALMLENAAYLSDNWSAEQKLEWAKQTTGRAFYPRSPVWRKAILNRGITLLSQAMERSVQWRPSL